MKCYNVNGDNPFPSQIHTMISLLAIDALYKDVLLV